VHKICTSLPPFQTFKGWQLLDITKFLHLPLFSEVINQLDNVPGVTKEVPLKLIGNLSNTRLAQVPSFQLHMDHLLETGVITQNFQRLNKNRLQFNVAEDNKATRILKLAIYLNLVQEHLSWDQDCKDSRRFPIQNTKCSRTFSISTPPQSIGPSHLLHQLLMMLHWLHPLPCTQLQMLPLPSPVRLHQPYCSPCSSCCSGCSGSVCY